MPACVLVADDDPLLRELVSFKLESTGHVVACAADGAAALDVAREQQPNLIILDSMMPVLSGPEVLRALKDDPATAAIPVLMLTSRKGQDDVVNALRGGASDYLTKPFLPDELAMRVQGLLARGANERRDA
jgi:DNA-binding response OmpR family regulator